MSQRYQRAFELISGQASNGPFGSPVFACAGKTDPPSSSHPLADLGGYRCRLRRAKSPGSVTWRAPCLERPLPASHTGRAGARPDHSISGVRQEAGKNATVMLGLGLKAIG